MGLFKGLNHWAWAREIDFVAPDAELSRYTLVVTSLLYLLKKRDADNFDNYVRNGDVLFTTFFSGIVDGNERVVPGGYPAYLRKTLGL